MKLSNSIVMRLQSTTPPPALLKEASYDVFSTASWFNRDKDFVIIPVDQQDQWPLTELRTANNQTVRIEKYFPTNTGLVPHPYGSEQISGLNITELSGNRAGVLRIKEGNILQLFTVAYNGKGLPVSLPSKYNRQIPLAEQPVLQEIINNLHIEQLSNTEKIRTISLFLSQGFSYTLTTQGKGEDKTPLAHFLLHSKAGHCELFATATALLLREAGIPSRYVTGYVVAEKSMLEQKHIIRSRHAHAWTEAYVNDRWLILDTTPPDWLTEEEEMVSSFAIIGDFLSFLKHQFNLFRSRDRQNRNLPLAIILILLTAILLWQMYRRLKAKTENMSHEQHRKSFPPVTSPFILIDQELLHLGLPRRSTESMVQWLERINTTRPIKLKSLLQLYNQHQRLRFDPQGLSEKEYILLEKGVEQWLHQQHLNQETQTQNAD